MISRIGNLPQPFQVVQALDAAREQMLSRTRQIDDRMFQQMFERAYLMGREERPLLLSEHMTFDGTQHEMLSRAQQIDHQMLKQLFERAYLMGREEQTLEDEKIRLISENILLKNQINDLKFVCEAKWSSQATYWNSQEKANMAKIEIIYQKFKALSQKLNDAFSVYLEIRKNKKIVKQESGSGFKALGFNYHFFIFEYGKAHVIKHTHAIHAPSLKEDIEFVEKLSKEFKNRFSTEEQVKNNLQKVIGKTNQQIPLITPRSDSQAMTVVSPSMNIVPSFYVFEQTYKNKSVELQNRTLQIREENNFLEKLKMELNEMPKQEMIAYHSYLHGFLSFLCEGLNTHISNCERASKMYEQEILRTNSLIPQKEIEKYLYTGEKYFLDTAIEMNKMLNDGYKEARALTQEIMGGLTLADTRIGKLESLNTIVGWYK